MSDAPKIHPPTARRRQRARAEGRVAKSNELVSAIVLLLASVAMLFGGKSFVARLSLSMKSAFADSSIAAPSASDAYHWLLAAAVTVGAIVIPLVCFMLAVGVTSNILQTGFLFTPNRAAPSADRINPVSSIAQTLSSRQSVRSLFSFVKLLSLGLVTVWFVRSQMQMVFRLSELRPTDMAAQLFESLMYGSIVLAGTMLILGMIDYGLRWWQNEQDLRMTDLELREEMRDSEGPKQPTTTASAKPVTPV